MATTSKATSRRSPGGATKHPNECRVCLEPGAIIPIFGDKSKPDISIDVTAFGAIHVSKGDGFSKFLCENCHNLLQNAISFRKAAKRSDALLKKRNRSTEIKFEEVEVKIETAVFIVDENKDEVNKCKEKISDCLYENKSDVKDEQLYDTTQVFDNQEDGDDYRADNDIDSDLFVSADDKILISSCKSCKLKFQTLEEYEEHCLTTEHKKKHVAKSPKKNISKDLNVKKVKKMPAGPKDQKCGICNEYFTKFMFPRHIKEKHGIKPGKETKTKECPYCKKLFRPDYVGRHILLVHTESETGLKKYIKKEKPKVECPICKKMFAALYYPVHVKKHDQENTNYICDQCGKKFVFLSAFCNHRLIHSNDLPHKCEYCPYRGRSKHLLRIHVRTHTGNYPYKCDLCDVRCITKSNLNRHMRRHQGATNFNCDTCNRGFYSKHELETHVSVIHLGVRNHICNICGVAFGYKHGLSKHQRKVHKKAKGEGKAKATYLKLQEQGLLEKDTT